MIRPRHSTAAAGLVVLSILVAACGSSAPPSAGTPATTTAQPAASLAATVHATVVPSAVASSSASPAPALKLLWEKAGDAKPLGHNADSYWPAIDPLTGNVWVAVSFESIYWIFSPDG